MTEEHQTQSVVDEVRRLLTRLPADPREVVQRIGRARDLLDEALNEAMAEATLVGVSMREVAKLAGISPNSVPPRLARSSSLSPYSSEGWVTGPSIERARYDADLGRPASEAIPAPKTKLTFQRRRPTTTSDGNPESRSPAP